ncbi:MAG: hypothetical protein AAF441_16865 [Pseudomonadota bacterium]
MLRKPTFAEICVQAVIAAAIMLWLHELYGAAQAFACIDGAVGAGCYPWGPQAADWRLLSKELYIVHLIIVLQFLVAGLALPWFTAAPSSTFAGLAILVWIFLCGHYAARLIIF